MSSSSEDELKLDARRSPERTAAPIAPNSDAQAPHAHVSPEKAAKFPWRLSKQRAVQCLAPDDVAKPPWREPKQPQGKGKGKRRKNSDDTIMGGARRVVLTSRVDVDKPKKTEKKKEEEKEKKKETSSKRRWRRKLTASLSGQSQVAQVAQPMGGYRAGDVMTNRQAWVERVSTRVRPGKKYRIGPREGDHEWVD
mmetsp:Transcript_158376/g.280825  ORF Transcript_158376/g.280825 Transcript_158376/m.280825 type:complete len:195 (+) Transcript_158376:74-658(+)